MARERRRPGGVGKQNGYLKYPHKGKNVYAYTVTPISISLDIYKTIVLSSRAYLTLQTKIIIINYLYKYKNITNFSTIKKKRKNKRNTIRFIYSYKRENSFWFYKKTVNRQRKKKLIQRKRTKRKRQCLGGVASASLPHGLCRKAQVSAVTGGCMPGQWSFIIS